MSSTSPTHDVRGLSGHRACLHLRLPRPRLPPVSSVDLVMGSWSLLYPHCWLCTVGSALSLASLKTPYRSEKWFRLAKNTSLGQTRDGSDPHRAHAVQSQEKYSTYVRFGQVKRKDEACGPPPGAGVSRMRVVGKQQRAGSRDLTAGSRVWTMNQVTLQ